MKKKSCLDKKGSGHIEMIFSFIFFTGFIFFLFLILKPYDSLSMLDSLNRGLASEFEKNISTNLTTFFMEVNYSELTGGENCFSINLSEEKDSFKKGFSNSLVKNVSDGIVNSSLSSDGLLNILVNSPSLEKDHFKVFISPDFTETPGSCVVNPPKLNYTRGSIIEMELLSYKSLKELNQSYANNYASVKESLNVPEVYDFAIVSDDLPEINMDSSREIPIQTEVFAKNYYFRVLKEDGSVINAGFVIRVW